MFFFFNLFSYKKIQAIKEILLHFLKWLEVLDIEECYREKLRSARCLQKVSCIICVLESSSSLKTKYFQRTGNKVSPILTGIYYLFICNMNQIQIKSLTALTKDHLSENF